ncbi:hypothetical protein Godav_020740 [Gossypium davidsonii]|uniref:RNase H type-1 domain-containing protein n=1 Tax=Gossypium davidsonii TaxID=34287 RepID=A0A7J8R3X8_GOSDV|nr:hypothetical protein [Gossypium davidsonii]
MDQSQHQWGWKLVGDWGVLCDSFGNWIEGFQRFIGRRSVVVTELWAILHGLKIVQKSGYTKVIIESDCMIDVDMIKECFKSIPSMTLVRKIKKVSY